MPRTSTLRTVAFAAGAGVALLLPALGAASSLAAPPAPASAAASAIAPPTVGTLVSAPENSALSVTARVGKANVLAIALSNTTFTVRDTGDTVMSTYARHVRAVLAAHDAQALLAALGELARTSF